MRPDQPTRVVNIHREKGTRYIGRAGHGEDGLFGNPFALDAKRRHEPAHVAQVLGRYVRYFLARVASDHPWRRAVLDLRGEALGCFCVGPEGDGACHGKIIAAWLDVPEGSGDDVRLVAVQRALDTMIAEARAEAERRRTARREHMQQRAFHFGGEDAAPWEGEDDESAEEGAKR